MKSVTVANQITLEAWRLAVIFQEATMVEHRTAQLLIFQSCCSLPMANLGGESCRRIYTGSILEGGGGGGLGSELSFPRSLQLQFRYLFSYYSPVY